MFYDYLKNGGYIRIESDNKHNIGYTATVFYRGNTAVYAYNKELGDFPHEKFTNNPAAFDAHVQKMLDEKFRVVLYSR